MGGEITMRKHIIILVFLFIIIFSFCSCVEMIIIGGFWIKSKNSPLQETYIIYVDKSLVTTDTLSVEFVSGRIPRIISDNYTSYYDDTNYTFTSIIKGLDIGISKKIDSKADTYIFFDDAICTDTIRLYRNDTLIVEWDKAIINTHHNIYNHNQWTIGQSGGCWENVSNVYYFSITQEDIEKWENGE